MRLSKKIGIEVTLLGACLLLGASMPAGIPAPQDQQSPAADNTKTNKDKSSPTADQQKMNPADRELTKKIRASINSDKTLSTYAHNVKIISQDGKVTLRGPVRSEDEKAAIESKASAIAGPNSVTNMLDVAPPKS
ncbi:MAG TPA: BON domain-containing protein [Candidatus Eisenbacteria bacterium]|jgi:osmotically-inducible protein OsmY|nr:BON domain-containing protein [Candidatus Eisenbacteria bacterium]